MVQFGKFGRAARVDPNTNIKKKGPGPGAYKDFQKPSGMKNAPSFGMGTEQRMGPVKGIHKALPGPAAYKQIYSGLQGGPTKDRSKSIVMAGKTPATGFIGLAVGKDAERQPGPGAHS